MVKDIYGEEISAEYQAYEAELHKYFAGLRKLSKLSDQPILVMDPRHKEFVQKFAGPEAN